MAFCCSVAACGAPIKEEASRTEAELVTSRTPGVKDVHSFLGDRTFEECTLIAKSDLLIRGSLTLRAGATLIVKPLDRRTVDNTWIYVAGVYLPGGHELTVEGSLIAEGTASRPITIKGSSPWVGVRVTGGESRLAHVHIDGAELGIKFEQGHNTVRHLRTAGALFGLAITSNAPLDETVEDYSGGAVSFLGGGGGRASVSDVRIDLRDQRSVSGLSFNGIEADVDDAIILGNKKSRDTVGIATAAGSLRVERAFVSGFGAGVTQYSENTELEITDATLVDNVQGVRTKATVAPRPECEPNQAAFGYAPAAIAKDPRIVRSDIVRNEIGVLHQMPTILSIEDTNIQDNMRGIYIEGRTLHPDSKVQRSNVYANGDVVQVFSKHVVGTIDLSGNYWGVPQEQAFEFAYEQGFRCPQIPAGAHVCTGIEASKLASAGVRTSTLSADMVTARAAVGLR